MLGLGDSVKATEYVIQAIIDEGLKPGVDMGVAFDVAANSFFADGKYHLGKDASGNDIVLDRDGMIKYITDMVDLFQAKYGKGVITSVEDGLEENDFEGQAKLTVELKKRGVRTIGDDSFVTQEGRLVKGIKAGANDTILIKINQNGTLGGTLDVMTIANENDYESVVSHRSGETLDDIIADLADGTNAYGLKTGAPQPAELFSDPSKLVRRTKYLRMIKLQEAGAHNGKALVVGPEFFKETAGIRVGLNLIADELAQGVKVVLYGPSAENLKLLVGARNILTAATQEEALGRLTSLGFAAQNVLVLNSTKAQAVKAQGIRVINAAKPSLIALAKAAETLINTEKATQALSTYYKGMADTGVISQETYSATKAAMVSTITGMLDVPSANVKYSDAVEQGIAAKSIAEKEFLNRV